MSKKSASARIAPYKLELDSYLSSKMYTFFFKKRRTIFVRRFKCVHIVKKNQSSRCDYKNNFNKKGKWPVHHEFL